jgi:hypothetical protein
MNDNQLEVVKPEQTETALYLLTKAEIDTQIATAKAFPRSLATFTQKAMSMVMLSEDIAASCTYVLPRGGNKLEGPSIRLAEIAAASYGNNQYGGRVIANDGAKLTAQGVFIDLENNVKVTVEVERRITDKNGKTYNQDMQIMAGNAAIAIAIRNSIFKGIPGAFIIPIWDKAKEVARGTAETLAARRDKALAYFKSLNVTDKQILDVLEITKVGDIDLDKLETLTGIKAAIKNGESTVKDIFEDKNGFIVAVEDLQTLYELKKDGLAPDEQKNAERILSKKEAASYNKLYTLLQSK